MSIDRISDSSFSQRRLRQFLPWKALCILFAAFFLWACSSSANPRCPSCGAWNAENAAFCVKCLKALSWPYKPQSKRFHEVIARSGKDVFIRSPNDSHPQSRFEKNTGGDSVGPLGSLYSKTGLRYLIRFDVPEAFHRAGIPMQGFSPEQVLLILRLVPTPDARDDLPVVVHPLTVPFREGEGVWGKHNAQEDGCNWIRASNLIPWRMAGGDFDESIACKATLPRTGTNEVEIDVTDIFLPKFAAFQATGIWEDHGMLLMRDPTTPNKCLYRMVYSFESAVPEGILRHTPLVYSPELLFR